MLVISLLVFYLSATTNAKIACNIFGFRVQSPQVFLTVNSLASVSWSGHLTKRRLEINWVSPSDRQEDDFVGLYRDNPLNGPADPIVRVNAGTHDGYFLTQEEFPEINIHQPILQSQPRTMCLYSYWVAYIRSGRVLSINCIKIQPQWMWNMKNVIGSMPLHSLMIPGTHNSGAYDSLTSFTDDNVLMRYSVNQDEDVWTQLLMGVRYLDIRVGLYQETAEKYWLVHDFVRMNPLYEAIQAVKRFMRITKELVILDFHRFPSGFETNRREDHSRLKAYVLEELGSYMAPDWLGHGATLNDLWRLNRTLVVTYQYDYTEADSQYLWTEVRHAWGDKREKGQLLNFLGGAMEEKRSATYLWAAMTHLTPSTMDVFFNPRGGIRQINDKIARYVSGWYRDFWWNTTNIVATDFFLSNNLVDVARTNNYKRKCSLGLQDCKCNSFLYS